SDLLRRAQAGGSGALGPCERLNRPRRQAWPDHGRACVWTELANDPLTDKAFRDPGADSSCTEAYASLCRTGEALLGELDRRVWPDPRLPPGRATPLAASGGAGAP